MTNLVTISDSREIKLTWTHPFNLTDDGTFDSYDISCTAVDNTTVIASTLDAAGWVEEFVVGPLTPFRYYTCTVKAVTVGNGNSFPVMVTVATLEDGKGMIIAQFSIIFYISYIFFVIQNLMIHPQVS